MPRIILDIEGLSKQLPMTRNQLYKACKRPDYPLPYKKLGKKLMFDWERVLAWFDSLPGKDGTWKT
jgi:hypothetical protein